MPRLPEKKDFAQNAIVFISPPRDPVTHALILLHGLGDTIEPYKKLAQALNLSSTVVIALQAPNPMPFGIGGYQWCKELTFEGGGQGDDPGPLDPDGDFEPGIKLLRQVIHETLVNSCGFKMASEILLWGFGQGGMLALTLATLVDLSGVISIGGWLPSSSLENMSSGKRDTSILICGGERNSSLTPERVRILEDVFKDHYRRVILPTDGDHMPTTRDEMSPILRFILRITNAHQLRQQGLH